MKPNEGRGQPRRIPLPLKTHGGKFLSAPRHRRDHSPGGEQVYDVRGSVRGRGQRPPGQAAGGPRGGPERPGSDELVNFFQVLKDRATFDQLARRLAAVPVSETEWHAARDYLSAPPPDADPVERAERFLVLARQSLAGRRRAFTAVTTTRTRRGRSEQASAWQSAIDGLAEVHARLRRVVLLDRDGVDVVRRFSGPECFLFCDPPYHPATRSSPDAYGRYEMSATTTTASWRR